MVTRTKRNAATVKDVGSVGVLLAALALGYWDLREEVKGLRDEVTALRISIIRHMPDETKNVTTMVADRQP